MDRRSFLSATVTAGLASTAGCLGYTVVREEQLDTLQERAGEAEELEVVVADKEDRIEELETELDAVESQLEEKQRELEEVRSTHAETVEGLEELESEIDELQRTKSDLEDRLATLEPEADIPDHEIETAIEAALELRNSVVLIVANGSVGTGFYVDGRDYLTAEHVIGGATETTFLESKSGETTEYTARRADDRIDTQVLSAEMDLEDALEFGTIDDVSPGDTLFSVGHPYNVGDWVCSVGTFEGEEEETDLDELYRATVPGRRGTSGSPVFDLDGRVIGMEVVGLTRDDLYHAPEQLFTNFAAYEPDGGFVSIDTIEERLL
ncbi:serine protease Do [Halalkaliarchaeum desulfuricum]|uniref:Serine protease Do n=1 Tax=Halalkaliarchaeum desulfuricum TaxID=2055893 RepID=A0A343TLD5_9EURY|nr:serine protease [Halalkaliarchaeum desulfuricum]AUX09907.1 serine protease Do [Halalkaliarchaeum desulfuricum]